jgi:ankyrin repeat protein
MRGQEEIAKILIDKFSNVNAKDLVGRTPLFHAAKLNQLKITKMLLAAGANPMIRT